MQVQEQYQQIGGSTLVVALGAACLRNKKVKNLYHLVIVWHL